MLTKDVKDRWPLGLMRRTPKSALTKKSAESHCKSNTHTTTYTRHMHVFYFYQIRSPANDIATSLLRSSGGAHFLHIACAEGYVPP